MIECGFLLSKLTFQRERQITCIFEFFYQIEIYKAPSYKIKSYIFYLGFEFSEVFVFRNHLLGKNDFGEETNKVLFPRIFQIFKFILFFGEIYSLLFFYLIERTGEYFTVLWLTPCFHLRLPTINNNQSRDSLLSSMQSNVNESPIKKYCL